MVGKMHVDIVKRPPINSSWLNAYINKYVNKMFDR